MIGQVPGAPIIVGGNLPGPVGQVQPPMVQAIQAVFAGIQQLQQAPVAPAVAAVAPKVVKGVFDSVQMPTTIPAFFATAFGQVPYLACKALVGFGLKHKEKTKIGLLWLTAFSTVRVVWNEAQVPAQIPTNIPSSKNSSNNIWFEEVTIVEDIKECFYNLDTCGSNAGSFAIKVLKSNAEIGIGLPFKAIKYTLLPMWTEASDPMVELAVEMVLHTGEKAANYSSNRTAQSVSNAFESFVQTVKQYSQPQTTTHSTSNLDKGAVEDLLNNANVLKEVFQNNTQYVQETVYNFTAGTYQNVTDTLNEKVGAAYNFTTGTYQKVTNTINEKVELAYTFISGTNQNTTNPLSEKNEIAKNLGIAGAVVVSAAGLYAAKRNKDTLKKVANAATKRITENAKILKSKSLIVFNKAVDKVTTRK